MLKSVAFSPVCPMKLTVCKCLIAHTYISGFLPLVPSLGRDIALTSSSSRLLSCALDTCVCMVWCDVVLLGDVYVSALKYIKVCNCLAVGYSIGGFQVFDLGQHKLV